MIRNLFILNFDKREAKVLSNYYREVFVALESQLLSYRLEIAEKSSYIHCESLITSAIIRFMSQYVTLLPVV